MELAAIAWPAAELPSPVAVTALRRRLTPAHWPAELRRDGQPTAAATIRSVMPDALGVPMDPPGVRVRVQVNEPGEFQLAASWPGAAHGTWARVDARGRPLGASAAASDGAARWIAERPGWFTWAWRPAG